MFQKLVSRNEDLRRLYEKGYAIGFDTNNCLIVRDVFYLDGTLALRRGAIVAKLVFVDKEAVRQDDHQVYFAGEMPHGLDGKPIPNFGGGPCQVHLSAENTDVVVQRSFSNKPKKTGAYANFFEKIESYVDQIAGPAMAKFGRDASPLTHKANTGLPPDPIFKFPDTLSSRAGISDLREIFKDEVVAIIGVGGTGAYLLDLLVKTPVKEIRFFDLDDFHVHNAYRSPGRLEEHELGKPKTEVYLRRYEGFRHGLTARQLHVGSDSAAELAGVTFAFVSVDKGSSRSAIFDVLIAGKIPFIDVGMGLKRKGDPLSGMLRVTYYPVDRAEEVRAKGYAEMSDPADNLYRTNIQIGELNALNACLAVVKYKEVRGFYGNNEPMDNYLFDVSDMKIAS
ncbi:MAG: ThiF family adenylyltransferase [Opitutae bacterium]|nr:ThiF family adenylyltransferase [Opitutae bacterium]